MTNRQKIELRLSEVRSRLNAISGFEGDALTEEIRGESETLRTEYADLETRHQAAIVAEPEPEPSDRNGGEGAEVRRLIGETEIRAYLVEAATGREADGAASELRAAIFGDKARAGLVPWEALLVGRPEHRADVSTDAPGTTGASQQTVLGRVFADTALTFLGVGMPMVPVGDVNFPVLSAGVTPAMIGRKGEKGAQAATISATVLEPRRMTARYLFQVEDVARLRGLEEALRIDLSGALGEAMDAAGIKGNGETPMVNGFINAIDAPADAPDALSGRGDFIGAAAGAVDGRYARNVRGVRMLVGSASYTLAATLVDLAGRVYVSDYLIERTGGFQVSAHIPAAANSIQDGLVYRAENGIGSAVAPIWNGFELIRDPFSNAAEGQVSVTAVALWNFAILRPAAFNRVQFFV